MTGVIIGRVKNQKGAERKMNIRQVTDGKEDYIELLRAGDRMNPNSKIAGKRRTVLIGRTRKAPHTLYSDIFRRKEM